MPHQTCSFCDKPENEVKALIGKDTGPHICNQCVGSCGQMLEQMAAKADTKEKVLGTPKEIKAYLDEYVIGQEACKIDVAVAVYNHYKRHKRKAAGFEGVEIKKSNILIPGPSGTGKTEVARTIARMLDVPFYVADATKLTSAGYVGDDAETMLQGLVSDAGGDIERAQKGIIVIDEIDKLARKTGRGASGYRDVTGEGAQQAILKIVEGDKILVPRGNARFISDDTGGDTIDTSDILFICAGSFAGIEDCVKKRVNKDAAVGFRTGTTTDRRELSEDEVYSELIEEDVLEFGIIPELAGRLPVITCTLPLTEEEMVRILTEPKNAIVKQFQALFALDDIDLQFDDDALKAIGRMAKDRPTGARALRSITERVLKSYAYELPSDKTVKGLRITQAVVEDGAEAPIIRENGQKAVPALAGV